MMLILSCPNCRQRMKYQPRKEIIGKKKQCVYCGKTFTVNRDRIISHSA
ncbi:MAG: hypothetical protein KC535_00225 [Nanoarchaeota archaeon]|nr:hypothetical protein [Nanoarchaeota archaeon]